MFLLGRALALGNKHLEAMKYDPDAADRGHAGAMNDVGGVFEYGLGLPKNMATALVWYERAAEIGDTGAMIYLGRLSEKGVEVPQDFAKARDWYEKAAALDDASAMNDLADSLRQGRGAEPNRSRCRGLVPQSRSARPCKCHEQSRLIARSRDRHCAR